MKREPKDLRKTLMIRGFSISESVLNDKLLIPKQQYIDSYYRQMHTYAFRIFLRDIIKHQNLFTTAEVSRFTSPEVTDRYIQFLCSVNLCGVRENGYYLRDRPVKSFGKTLEWYVSEIFEREFDLDVLWGKRLKGLSSGGDFDILTKIDNHLLMMEIKSSPPKAVYNSEILSYLNRFDELSPDIALFFLDTELRMKDKIVPMFEQALSSRYDNPPPVIRMVKELFHIQNRIFIINAKGGVANNLGRVFKWFYRYRNPLC